MASSSALPPEPRSIHSSIPSAFHEQAPSLPATLLPLLQKPRALRPTYPTTTTLPQRHGAALILPEDTHIDPRIHNAPRLPMELAQRPEPQFLLHFRPRSREELLFPDLGGHLLETTAATVAAPRLDDCGASSHSESSYNNELTTSSTWHPRGSPEWIDLEDPPLATSSSDDEEPLQCCLWLRPRPSKRQRRTIVS